MVLDEELLLLLLPASPAEFSAALGTMAAPRAAPAEVLAFLAGARRGRPGMASSSVCAPQIIITSGHAWVSANVCSLLAKTHIMCAHNKHANSTEPEATYC
jgi:hypothetical protein